MKPDTYTKLYVHAVFTPKGRHSLLTETIRINVHKYIYGILKEKKCYPIAINGTADHIHLLFGFPPVIAIADIVRDVKRSSALFINQNHIKLPKFSWQEGYGAFTVGHRDLNRVYQYVLNQEEHHSKTHFKEEYLLLLTEEGVDYNPDYLYEFYED
jgi:REP element-mobilizing transposase RayT